MTKQENGAVLDAIGHDEGLAGEAQTRLQICELLALFYQKGWISGTGGGICAGIGDDQFLMAPTGVHKERVTPDDLFVVAARTGDVVRAAQNPALRLSECAGIFRAIIQHRAAGAVLHSHALATVLAGDLAPDADQITLRNLEMLKGLRGGANTDLHVVPIVHNTPRECDLVESIHAVLASPAFSRAYAILVRDHGAYIWGADLWEAKRHAEAYHFLFEATIARANRMGYSANMAPGSQTSPC